MPRLEVLWIGLFFWDWWDWYRPTWESGLVWELRAGPLVLRKWKPLAGPFRIEPPSTPQD